MASKNIRKSRQSPTPKTIKNPTQPVAKQPIEPTNRPTGLTVVGIGASAGGLAAMNSFFSQPGVGTLVTIDIPRSQVKV